jgi:hypothetical protein
MKLKLFILLIVLLIIIELLLHIEHSVVVPAVHVNISDNIVSEPISGIIGKQSIDIAYINHFLFIPILDPILYRTEITTEEISNVSGIITFYPKTIHLNIFEHLYSQRISINLAINSSINRNISDTAVYLGISSSDSLPRGSIINIIDQYGGINVVFRRLSESNKSIFGFNQRIDLPLPMSDTTINICLFVKP